MKVSNQHLHAYFGPSQIPAKPFRDLDPAQEELLGVVFRHHHFILLFPAA